MKVFYDTEFIDDGSTVELISIGMVREDGTEYYAVVKNIRTMLRAWNMKSGNEYWLRNNVVRHLPFLPVGDYAGDWDKEHPDYGNLRTLDEIRVEVLAFLRNTPDVEYWAWYAAYDHVALSQIFGRMIDLPAGLPMWTNDLRQEVRRLGDPQVPEQKGGNHNALEDARWNRTVAEYLEYLEFIRERSVANPLRTQVV